MRKMQKSNLKKKNDMPRQKDVSVHLNSLQMGVQQQTSELELAARNIIKHFDKIKNSKNTIKTEQKLHRVYSNLIRIIHKLFSQFFSLEICRDLSQILNKLVYFYEIDENKQPQKQNCMSIANLPELLSNCTTTRVYNENVKIENVVKGSEKCMKVNVKKQKILKENQNIKTERPDKLKQNKIKSSGHGEFRIFIYEKMKKQYNTFLEEKQQLNIEVNKVNERICLASNQIEEKIRNFQMKKVIENNKIKLAAKINKLHEKNSQE